MGSGNLSHGCRPVLQRQIQSHPAQTAQFTFQALFEPVQAALPQRQECEEPIVQRLDISCPDQHLLTAQVEIGGGFTAGLDK